MKLFKTLIPTIVLLVLFSEKISAQKINIKFTPVEKNKEKSANIWNLYKEVQYTEDEDALYSRIIIDNDDRTISVDKVSKKDGQSIWVKLLPLDPKDELIKLIKIKEGFLMFCKNKHKLEVHQLGEDLIRNGKPQLLQEDSASDYFGIQLNGNNISFTTRKSKIYKFTVIDLSFKIRNETEVDLSKYKTVQIDEHTLDEEGNITTLFKVFTNNKNLDNKNVAFEYLVYHYDLKTNTSSTANVSWGDQFKYYFNLQTRVTKNNIIYVYGLYHATKDDAGNEGVFMATFDANIMKQVRNDIIPFDQTFIGKLIDAKDASKGRLPVELQIQNFFEDTDGNISFVINQKYDVESITNGRTSYAYNCDDIIIWKIAKTGTPIWSYLINKSSISYSNDKFISTYSFSYNDNIFVLFNSEKGFAEQFDKGGIYYIHANKSNNISKIDPFVMVLLCINKDGIQTVKKLINQTQEEDEKVAINNIKQVAPNILLLKFEEKSVWGIIKNHSNAIVEIKD